MILRFIHDLEVRGMEPQDLSWQHRACLGFFLSLFLCPSSARMCSLSLKINKYTLKKKKRTLLQSGELGDLKKCRFRGACLAQSVQRMTLDFSSGHNLHGSWDWALHRALRWQHRACLGFSLSLPLCPFPIHAVSVSLKNKWMNFKKKKKRIHCQDQC